MLYARVNKETNEVLEFPLNENEVRDNLANTTLPTPITDVSLAATQYVRVHPIPESDVDVVETATHRMYPGTAWKNEETGTWYRTYTLVEVPEKDQETRIRKRWAYVRATRDRLLRNLDWKVARYHRQVRLGLTPTDDIAVLDARMQELADVTEGVVDPYTIDVKNL